MLARAHSAEAGGCFVQWCFGCRRLSPVPDARVAVVVIGLATVPAGFAGVLPLVGTPTDGGGLP